MTNSLADKAHQLIRRDIIQCVLEPGLMVAQGQLVEMYALGITPIREALKRLEQEGFVQSIPRFGYLITPVTVEDIENIYELRLILEKPAVRLAAQRASDAQLAEIEKNAQFTYRYKDTQSYQEFLQTNVAFHTAIALTSGNRRLAENIARLLDDMTRIFHLGLDLRDSAEEMKNEHLALASVLGKRNAELAEEIVEDQIRRSQQRVLEMLNQRSSVRTQTTLTKNTISKGALS
jgi:DNA-binding GntR family transcriptional regulator